MLQFQTDAGQLACRLQRLVVAGWTGRDRAAVDHHIAELAAIGVPGPSTVPLYYEVAPDLATQAPEIAVLGSETSGEAEPLLLRTGGRLWLGLASDHTDRWLETVSVAHAKQACPKVLSVRLWPLDSLAGRLDGLVLHAEIGGGTVYQSGTLAAIRPLEELLAACPLGEDEAMLCGTLPVIGGVRPAESYVMRLADGDRDAIEMRYRVRPLPVIG